MLEPVAQQSPSKIVHCCPGYCRWEGTFLRHGMRNMLLLREQPRRQQGVDGAASGGPSACPEECFGEGEWDS